MTGDADGARLEDPVVGTKVGVAEGLAVTGEADGARLGDTVVGD